MEKILAAITGVHGFVPEFRLTNKALVEMVDTNEEWIKTRTGIEERRILKGVGLGTSDLGVEAIKGLLAKTNTKPEEIDLLICATITPDMLFPATACIIADKIGIKAFAFDINAACSGFLYALTIANSFVQNGTHKKVIVVGADKMSSITDYTDRQTCILFGDGAAAVLVEPSTDTLGIIDAVNYSDGVGRNYLYQTAGGSCKPASFDTVAAGEHFIHQEGQAVYKYAVKNMADVAVEIMERNKLTFDDIAWLVPHQANIRIIEAVANRMGVSKDKVMLNIEKYGNTTAATIPLCLWDFESQLKKGDNLVLTAFGGGFTWGAMYVKWAY